MATVQQAAPQSISDYVRKVSESDPKTALEIVIAETERVRRQAEIAQIEHREQAEVVFGPNGLQASNMAGIWRMARMFADSDLVPDHFKKKPANCFIAIQMAMRCKVDPFAFLQKCYIVHGRPAIETQLAVAMANSSGIFKGRIHYELSGEADKRQCRAWAVIADDGEIVEETITVRMAKDSGWWDKKGSLWPQMTDLFLKYRAAMWLIRTNAPEVLMGLLSQEEATDAAGELPATQPFPRRLDELTERLNGSGSPVVDATEDKPQDLPAEENTNGEADAPVDSETTTSTTFDADTFFASLSEELDSTEAILAVGKIEARYLDTAPDDEAKALVKKVCHDRREAIRASRGGKETVAQ